MNPPVRWYNRLAAWLFDVCVSALAPLAEPVWVEDVDYEPDFDDAWLDEIIRDSQADGYDEGWRDAERGDGRPW